MNSTTSKAILLLNIQQKDNYSFTIDWSDGTSATYSLSELQKKCPCANCNDEVTGKRVVDPATVQPDVRAVRIKNVGRYAMKIQFTSGCSTGIYDYNMLHKIGNSS